MLFKLSINNIKKSIKDYSIYFFTLVFSVMMFYLFNSLDSQKSMLILNQAQNHTIEMVIYVLNYVSVFVSVVLGFLIVYSNKFIIKKRKKEIGLYFTLGMSKRKVSLILVIESLIIGIISLLVGLLLGVVLSQFLSIFTAKLFEVDMTSLKFVFSSLAFAKTCLYFGLIFIIVLLFNLFTLSRFKLIDLISADQKNEIIKNKNKYIILLTFIGSLLLIGYAYYLLFDNALLNMDNRTTIMLIAGSIGTFLLFYSLSGFLLKLFQRIKKVYYKDLNLFTFKQINNKINTTVVSSTVICLLLLLTIGILSCSFSLASAFNTDITDNNLTEFTIKSYTFNETQEDKNQNLIDIDNLQYNSSFNSLTSDYTVVHRYLTNIKVSDMMYQSNIDKLVKEYGSSLSLNFNIQAMSESEYKKLMNVQNSKVYDIEDNEYLLLTNIDFIMDAYKDYYEDKKGITINNKLLVPGTDKIINIALENYNSAGNDGILVISDNLVSDLTLDQIVYNGNFINEDKLEAEEEMDKVLKSLFSYRYDLRTTEKMKSASVGLKSLLIYVGLYLGLTFAITSATVLAIGQLSQISDNKKRYKILSRIGVSDKMTYKSIFIQILLVFMFPLLIALIHSYFGLKEMNSLINTIGHVDLSSNIILTTIFMIIIYGGYFLLTYLSSKRIIKQL